MSGHHENDEPIELHDQQLQFYEHRFSEHVVEGETYRQNVNVSENAISPRILPVLALNEVFIGESLSSRYIFLHLSRFKMYHLDNNHLKKNNFIKTSLHHFKQNNFIKTSLHLFYHFMCGAIFMVVFDNFYSTW